MDDGRCKEEKRACILTVRNEQFRFAVIIIVINWNKFLIRNIYKYRFDEYLTSRMLRH